MNNEIAVAKTKVQTSVTAVICIVDSLAERKINIGMSRSVVETIVMKIFNKAVRIAVEW